MVTILMLFLLLLAVPRSARAAETGQTQPSENDIVWPADPWPVPRELSYLPGHRMFTELRLRCIRSPAGLLWGVALSPVIPVPPSPPNPASRAPLLATRLTDSRSFNPRAMMAAGLARAQARIARAVPLPAGTAAVPLFVSVTIARPKQDHSGKIFGLDESYWIRIPAAGGRDDDIKILAQTTAGALRALATLPQLVARARILHSATGQPARALRLAQIADRPAKVYRGLMVDVARTFFPLADLRRTLDAMEVVKMNVLHLHLFDSEAFPLMWNGTDRGKAWTMGAKRGSNGEPLVYTAWNLRALATYAAQRGIALLPGAEGPAHVDILDLSNPALVVCNPNQVTKSGQFNPYHRQMPGFITRLYRWLQDDAFPSSTVVHVGGDEVC